VSDGGRAASKIPALPNGIPQAGCKALSYWAFDISAENKIRDEP